MMTVSDVSMRRGRDSNSGGKTRIAAAGAPAGFPATAALNLFPPGHVDPVLPYGGSLSSISSYQVSQPVVREYGEVAPEVQALIQTALGIYTARGHKQLSRVFDCFQFNCVFDLPFFFCRGADRMRVLSNLLAAAFDRVEARPKVVSLYLVNAKMALIDLEAELHFHPRARFLPFASRLVPETVVLRGNWTIVTGDDEKIINVTELLDNLPFVPQLLRGVWTTLITALGLSVSGW